MNGKDMTPAERLLAAADQLDKLASGAISDWKVDDDNHLALVSITTPSATFPFSRYSFTGPNDATTHYIATMHPEVGKALAAWLRAEGSWLERRGHVRAFGGAPLFRASDEALALADLILAGGEPS